MSEKHYLDIDVCAAARKRIEYVFDNFPKIYLSFSGGKDSSVMMHLVMDEAKKRNRKIAILFVDLEAQYNYTIQHINEMIKEYENNIELYWVSLPIALRNAVSVYEPKWLCWEPGKNWVREPDPKSITDAKYFPFFYSGMEFEEFVPKFGEWYSEGKLTACFVGIRSDESLNRYRTIVRKNKMRFLDKSWTTWVYAHLYNIYPIYDFKTRDIWIYNGKYYKIYNKLYDVMHKAGLSIHQQRICQPYGDDQRKGLWLYHLIEPDTWGKVVARVNGANSGSLYAQESGNILGNFKITKPENHTWESFAKLLLKSMPVKTKEHYENKIFQFLQWWALKGYPKIPDEADKKLEASKDIPSWRRICKTLLRNDYWCKGLSFSQTKAESYERYKKVMKKRKKSWQI